MKKFFDNKLFCKTIKPSLPDRLAARDRIHLTEKDEIVKSELEAAETIVFLQISNLKILKCADYDHLINNIENRTVKAFLKYRKHLSVLAVYKRKKQVNFYFKDVSTEDT